MPNKSQILENIKTILEIIAIPVAALWAYTRFKQVDAPELLPRFTIQSSLDWNAGSSGECLGTFDVQLANTGKRTIVVDSLRIAAWLASPPRTATTLRALEPAQLESSPPVSDTTYRDRLTGRYEPTNASGDDFVFAAPKVSEKFALFQVLVWAHGDGLPVGTSWSDYRWDWVCGSPQKGTESKKG